MVVEVTQANLSFEDSQLCWIRCFTQQGKQCIVCRMGNLVLQTLNWHQTQGFGFKMFGFVNADHNITEWTSLAGMLEGYLSLTNIILKFHVLTFPIKLGLNACIAFVGRTTLLWVIVTICVAVALRSSRLSGFSEGIRIVSRGRRHLSCFVVFWTSTRTSWKKFMTYYIAKYLMCLENGIITIKKCWQWLKTMSPDLQTSGILTAKVLVWSIVAIRIVITFLAVRNAFPGISTPEVLCTTF